jgi:hypothetical protein
VRRYKRRSKRTGKYKSVLEKKIAKILGRKATYETEVLQYVMPKRYTPDFVVALPSDGRLYLEVKGFFRREDQAKMRAVKRCNPTTDIRMYFPNDNKVQGGRMTNSEWCKKYEFPFYIGELPKDL